MQTQPRSSHQLWISLNDSCWPIVTVMLSSIFFLIRQKTQSLLLIICIRHTGQFIFLLLYELFTTIFLKYSNYSKTIFCSEWWIACSQNEDCEYVLKIKLQFCSNFHRHKSIEKKIFLHQCVEDKTAEAIGAHQELSETQRISRAWGTQNWKYKYLSCWINYSFYLNNLSLL